MELDGVPHPTLKTAGSRVLLCCHMTVPASHHQPDEAQVVLNTTVLANQHHLLFFGANSIHTYTTLCDINTLAYFTIVIIGPLSYATLTPPMSRKRGQLLPFSGLVLYKIQFSLLHVKPHISVAYICVHYTFRRLVEVLVYGVVQF